MHESQPVEAHQPDVSANPEIAVPGLDDRVDDAVREPFLAPPVGGEVVGPQRVQQRRERQNQLQAQIQQNQAAVGGLSAGMREERVSTTKECATQ